MSVPLYSRHTASSTPLWNPFGWATGTPNAGLGAIRALNKTQWAGSSNQMTTFPVQTSDYNNSAVSRGLRPIVMHDQSTPSSFSLTAAGGGGARQRALKTRLYKVSPKEILSFIMLSGTTTTLLPFGAAYRCSAVVDICLLGTATYYTTCIYRHDLQITLILISYIVGKLCSSARWKLFISLKRIFARILFTCRLRLKKRLVIFLAETREYVSVRLCLSLSDWCI